MSKSMISNMIAFLRGGTSSFNEAELLLINSVITELPLEESEILRKQVSSISLVQRHNPGRLIAAYYPEAMDVPILAYPGYEYCLAKVRYKLGVITRATYIVLHDGKIMTLERNVPIKGEKIETVIDVVLHPKDYKPIAEEVDSGEHKKSLGSLGDRHN